MQAQETHETLRQLLHQEVELYARNVNVEGQYARLYVVTNREPGRLEGYLLGEISGAFIQGTMFSDAQKQVACDRFEHGEISYNELEEQGGLDGFDPMPQGDYLIPLGSIGLTSHQRPSLGGSGTYRFGLESNQTFGDMYRMRVELDAMKQTKEPIVFTRGGEMSKPEQREVIYE